MKRIALLIAAIIICMAGCYKEPNEEAVVIARPIANTYMGDLHVYAPDYGESLEQKRGEFSKKMQEIKRALKVRRLPQRMDSIEVCRPVEQ
jgi:hypothetical protein